MHNPVHILMADILHFSWFGYVLPDKPIFIFNASFLPRGVRIREVDGCFQSLADPLVAGELSSLSVVMVLMMFLKGLRRCITTSAKALASLPLLSFRMKSMLVLLSMIVTMAPCFFCQQWCPSRSLRSACRPPLLDARQCLPDWVLRKAFRRQVLPCAWAGDGSSCRGHRPAACPCVWWHIWSHGI